MSLPTGQKIKVVVADDAEPVRMMLAVMIESLGYEAVEAEDGQQAYELALSSGASIVVSDWSMPRLDGPGLCRKLRQEDRGRTIYIILLSMRDSHPDSALATDAGADEYLAKPVTLAQLRDRLQAAERIIADRADSRGHAGGPV